MGLSYKQWERIAGNTCNVYFREDISENVANIHYVEPNLRELKIMNSIPEDAYKKSDLQFVVLMMNLENNKDFNNLKLIFVN